MRNSKKIKIYQRGRGWQVIKYLGLKTPLGKISLVGPLLF